MIYGVVRSGGRGVPKCVENKESKGKVEKEQSRGTLKVGHLEGDTQVRGLLELLYYDLKPLYMTTNADPKLEWLKKKRGVLKNDQKCVARIDFHHLNIIDEYNYNMNNMDISDHLRGSCRFDHWICKRKWWRSIFLVLSNASNKLVHCL